MKIDKQEILSRIDALDQFVANIGSGDDDNYAYFESQWREFKRLTDELREKIQEANNED